MGPQLISSSKTGVWAQMQVTPKPVLVTSYHSEVMHDAKVNNHGSSPEVEITQMLMNWWMDKQTWHTHIMEYYLSIIRNDTLIHSVTQASELWEHDAKWKKLVKETTHCMIPFRCNVQYRQIHRDKTDWWLHRAGDSGGGRRTGSDCLKVLGFFGEP